MRRVLCATVLALAVSWGAASSAAAQTPPPLWLVAHGDSVTLQLPSVPADYFGFHVDRALAGGAFERITEAPVIPVRDVSLTLSVLGQDAPLLEDLTRSATSVQMVRRIQSDPLTASVYSYLFPSVAEALGRRWVDAGGTDATQTDAGVGLPTGARVRYRVVFLDAAGEETGEVREAEGEVRDVLPATPAALGGDAEADAVTLRWRYPRYAGAPDDFVVGFHVYRRDATGAVRYERMTDAPVARDDTADPVWVDRGVRSGAPYSYVVRAVDLIGREGPASEPYSVTPADARPPSPPASLTALPGEGNVRLAWRVPGELSVVGFRVERSEGLDQPFTQITDQLVPVDEPVWTDGAVVGGTQYFYRVVAVDGAGRASEASNPVGAIPFDNEAPDAPIELRATPSGRMVGLQWLPSDPADVSGYHVYRGESDGTFVRLTSEPIAATTFEDRGFDGEGLAPGRRYRIRVTALDQLQNESDPAEVEVDIPDDQPPGAPTGLSVTAEAGRALVVRWSAAPDLDVVRYVVTRVATTPGAVGAQEIVLDSVAASGPLLARDVAAVPGTGYRYRVAAIDAAGNLGAVAETEAVLRDETPPAPPAFAEAALGADGVVVVWARVAADDLARYRVYRALTPTGVGELVGDVPAPGGELRVLDGSGTADHYYRVVAVDSSGNESRPTGAVRAGGRR